MRLKLRKDLTTQIYKLSLSLSMYTHFKSKNSDRLTLQFFVHLQCEVSTRIILKNKDPHSKKTKSILSSLMDIKKDHSCSSGHPKTFLGLIFSPWQWHCYIGETKNRVARMHTHLNNAKSRKINTHIYNLMMKSGPHSFP